MTSLGETLISSVSNIEPPAQEADRQDLLRASLQRIGRTVARTTLSISLAVTGGAIAGTAAEMAEHRPPAAMATDFSNDYPHMDAAVHDSANYEWWVDENGDGKKQIKAGTNDELMSPRGFDYRNCTDGVAYWVMKYMGVAIPGSWGSANAWDTAASSYNVKAGTAKDIEPGDIAQSDDGAWGHVGLVIGVVKDSSGNVTEIEMVEMNKRGEGEFSHPTYSAKNSAGNFKRSGTYDWDHYIDLNGTNKGLNGEDLAPPSTPAPPANYTQGDYTADHRTDFAVFRPSTGTWYYHGGNAAGQQFGAPGDIPVPGDYDGDRKTDYAVYRPDNGTWHVRYSRGGELHQGFGIPGDIPAPGDFTGDTKADLAVFRPSDGTWHYLDGGDVARQFGASGDIPVPRDYDGDGKTDRAVFRPSNSTWYIMYANGSYNGNGQSFGLPGDIPVPADFTGDGKAADLAVFRPSDGTWHWYDGGDAWQQYGTPNDIPVAGDYNADGKTDFAVFRPSNDSWYVLYNGGGANAPQTFGWGSDIPAVGTLPLPVLRGYGLL